MCDDVTLGGYARSLGVRVFSSFSVLNVLLSIDRISQAEFVEALTLLHAAQANDLPVIPKDFVLLARGCNFDMGPSLNPLSRPPFWQDEAEGLGALNEILRGKSGDDVFIQNCLYQAMIGLVRTGINPARSLTIRVIQLAIAHLAVPAEGLPALVSAARQSFAAQELEDPFPICVQALLLLPVETPVERATLFASLIAGLEEGDRRVAMAMLLSPQATPSSSS